MILSWSGTMSLSSTLAGSTINSQIIEELARHNLNANPSINESRQFPICPEALSIKSMFGSWKTVQINCPSTEWKLVVRTNLDSTKSFVREELTYKKKSSEKFFVALNTSLDRGEVIRKHHLILLKTNKVVGGGVFYEIDQLPGRTLKRSLSVGTIIKARHLDPDWVVMKNQIITIEHKIGSIMITAKGIAQESGQIGQRIWVNNFNSGKKVLCWIKNDKKVTTNAKVY